MATMSMWPRTEVRGMRGAGPALLIAQLTAELDEPVGLLGQHDPLDADEVVMVLICISMLFLVSSIPSMVGLAL
jgi:hypothetical protein